MYRRHWPRDGCSPRLGFVVTLVAAYRLARLGGIAREQGWWAALLVAATPVCSGVPFEVRPDMLGVGLQTTGILLVLSALRPSPVGDGQVDGGLRLLRPGGVHQAALCGGPAREPVVAVAGLGARPDWPRVDRAICMSIALAIVVVYYGTEEWSTAGRMSRSIVVAAASVGKVHPADWSAAANLLLAVLWKCVGVILLLAAAGLAMVSARPGWDGEHS